MGWKKASKNRGSPVWEIYRCVPKNCSQRAAPIFTGFRATAQIEPQEDEDTCIQILQDKCREHVRGEYHKAKNGSSPVETFRVNISTQSDAEDSSNYDDDPTIYDGLEPPEVLDVGDKQKVVAHHEQLLGKNRLQLRYSSSKNP